MAWKYGCRNQTQRKCGPETVDVILAAGKQKLLLIRRVDLERNLNFQAWRPIRRDSGLLTPRRRVKLLYLPVDIGLSIVFQPSHIANNPRLAV